MFRDSKKSIVGFIGLGNMGFPMAENIMKAGFPLYVFNRTKEKAASLIEKGALFAASPTELASQCDVLITMVSNDEALKEIVADFLKGSKLGSQLGSKLPSIHISMSTVSPELVDILEKKHKERGITFLAAPVTGRPERAKAGSLWIFLAGESEAKKKASPILQAMSVKIFDLGEKPRNSTVFKLCNNFMILGFVELFSEASTLLEKNGISVEKALEIWGQSLFDAPILHTYAPMLSKRNFSDGGFALDLGLKDMRLLQTTTDSVQVSMPILDNLLEKLLASMNLGREKFDWSAIMLIARELAGLRN